MKGLFAGNWNPGYGFAAFALVYLARLNSLWIIPFAYFLSFLAIGGEMMARPLEIPTYFVEMLEGLMLLCFAVATWFERVHSPFARQEAVEVGSANAGDPPGPAITESVLEPLAERAGGRPPSWAASPSRRSSLPCSRPFRLSRPFDDIPLSSRLRVHGAGHEPVGKMSS